MSGYLRPPAHLVTADGTVFSGEAAGATHPIATGELVFNTAMSGYQEVITDPSYAPTPPTTRRPHRTAGGSLCAT
jgi:carbamoyl-phosphate synthase small subunit